MLTSYLHTTVSILTALNRLPACGAFTTEKSIGPDGACCLQFFVPSRVWLGATPYRYPGSANCPKKRWQKQPYFASFQPEIFLTYLRNMLLNIGRPCLIASFLMASVDHSDAKALFFLLLSKLQEALSPIVSAAADARAWRWLSRDPEDFADESSPKFLLEEAACCLRTPATGL